MTLVFAIDPGNMKSALVTWDSFRPEAPVAYEHMENVRLLARLKSLDLDVFGSGYEMVIEVPVPYMMPLKDSLGRRVMASVAGKEVYETIVWTGRFAEAWVCTGGRAPCWVTRPEVLVKLFGRTKGFKDKDVRQACIERYGGRPKEAIGTQLNPGPLYNVASHGWQALGLALAANGIGWEKVRRFAV